MELKNTLRNFNFRTRYNMGKHKNLQLVKRKSQKEKKKQISNNVILMQYRT